MILVITGVVLILYFIIFYTYAGLGSAINYIWLLGGAVLVVIGILKKNKKLPSLSTVPRWLRTILISITAIFAGLFLVVEGCVISGFFQQGKSNLDYIIVLGAQMKTSGPSKILRMRLDKAVEYLNANEDTIVIVSGGQGPDEPVSEAEGMYQYLVMKGIPAERIIKEEKSENTDENIEFSSKLMRDETCSVGIVTNNFHVFRAVGIAKKTGLEDACGIAAKSVLKMQPANMLREFFGIIKDEVAGNM